MQRQRRRWSGQGLQPFGSARQGSRPSTGARPDTAVNVRRAAIAMAVGFVLFALFESNGIRHVTRNLPGNHVSDVLVEAADQWHALMLQLGPARVGPAVWSAFEDLRSLNWSLGSTPPPGDWQEDSAGAGAAAGANGRE